MSEADVDIVVVFPDGAKKKERPFTFPSSTLVSDCLQIIIKKYHKYSNKVPSPESDEQLNLILSSKRLWLQTQQPIGFYEFPSQTTLELRSSRGTVRAVLSDGSARTFVVDRSKPVKCVLQEIAEKLRLGIYADTYGMRRSRARQGDDTDTIIGNHEPSDWLSVEDTLDAQNVAQTDEVLFCKRFVDRSPALTETNATDEHLTFSQARSEVLSGHHDTVLYAELQIQLAAVLLLHSAGRYDGKLPPSYVQDNAASILSPKWRKKPKSEMLTRIGMTHVAMSGLPWASDPRAIKQQFVSSMTKVSSFGVVSFNLEAVRTSDGGGCAAATMTISSLNVAIKPKKGSGGEKEAIEPLFHQPVTAITPVSAVRTLFTFSFLNSASATIFMTVVCKDAAIVRDNVCGFAVAANLRASASNNSSPAKNTDLPERSNSKRNLKQSSSNESLYTKSIETTLLDSTASTIKEMIQQADSVIDDAEKHLHQLVHLQKQSKEGKRLSSDEVASSTAGSPRTISQWFTKAATHLSSVSRGVSALEKKLKTGIFFIDEERTKSIASIAQWSTAIQLVSHCLIKSAEQTPTGIQTIAQVAHGTVIQARSFLRLIEEAETDPRGQRLTFEVSMAERALTTSCSALDLALQGRIADETSAVSLLTCCRDIAASARLMLDLAESVASDLPSSSSLRLEISKANAIFTWYSTMLATCSPVLFTGDDAVAGKVRAAIESIDSEASTLLSLSLDRSDSVDDATSAELAKRLNACWGSTNQSTKMFLSLSSTAQLPSTDLDPMLPPILYHLGNAVENLARSFVQQAKKVTPIIEEITTLSAAVVRSMAAMGSVEPNPMAVAMTAKLESAMANLRSLVRSSSGRSLKQLSEEDSEELRASVVRASFHVLDCATAIVSDTRYKGTSGSGHLQFQMKMLVMNLLHLRSLLRVASHPSFHSQKNFDTKFIQHVLEQIDVMGHGIAPTLGYFINQGSSSSDLDSLLAEWQEQFENLVSEINGETKELSFFSSSVHLHKMRLLSRFADSRSLASSIDPAPIVPKRKSGGSGASPDITIRRMQRKSGGSPQPPVLQRRASGLMLAMRASSLSLSINKADSPLSPRASLSAIHEDSASVSVLESGSEGVLEAVNEAGMLRSLRETVETGEIRGGIDLGFKDALDLFLVTFPYWSVAERITEGIINPLLSTRENGLESTEEKHMGMRVSIALSRYLRLHPQILQEPSCRLAVNSAVSAFKAGNLEDGARAVEDTMRECYENMSSFDRLKEELGSSMETLPPIDLFSVDLQALAEQMTLVEQRFFDAVTVPDLLQNAWSKKSNALSLWISHSNLMSRWVASRILQTPKKRDRAKLISRFMKLAENLRKLNNYSALITIFLALSMDCIARLRKTWDAGAGTLTLQLMKLSDSIKPLGNFSAYREDLKNSQAPCIPYMAVLLRDLVTLEEIIKDVDRPVSSPRKSPRSNRSAGSETSEDIFNFQNLATISRVVQSQFARFKKSRYQLLPDSKMYPELLRPDAFELLSEESLSEVSSRLEPDKIRPARSITTFPATTTSRRAAASLSLTVDVTQKAAVYGVRSQLGSSPPSSPTASVAERLGLSSPRASPAAPWKRHLSALSIQLENAALTLSSASKTKASQATSSVVEHISNSLRLGESPNSARKDHSRVRSTGSDDDTASSLALMFETEDLIFEKLPQLKHGWTQSLETEDTDTTAYSLSKHRSTAFHSTVLQILSVATSVINPDQKEILSAVRRVAITASSEENDSPILSVAYSIKLKDLQSVPEAADSEIISLLSPSANKYFFNWHGTLAVRSTSRGATKLHLSLSVPVRAAMKRD